MKTFWQGSQRSNDLDKTEPRNSRGSSYKRGIIHILLAAFFFMLMTLFLRLAGDLPTMEKALFRNIVAMVMAAVLLMKSGKQSGDRGKASGKSFWGSFRIKKGCGRDVFLRALFGTAGVVCNFWAIDRLGLADSNMLNKMSPFFAMLMSIFILKEIPDRFEWGALILAFSGAVLIVKPTAGLASIPAMVGLASGFFAGTAYTFLRKAGKKGERGPIIVFYFSFFSTLMVLPGFLLTYEPMSGKQFIYLLLTGLSAMGGQLNITAAYTYAPAKEISVFDYTQVIFAMIAGFFVFSEVPDFRSMLGFVIIIGTAIVKWKYSKGKSDEK